MKEGMVGDPTLFSPPRMKPSFLLFLLFAAAVPTARGHLLLYENVEVYLVDPERVRMEFTIHAPELPLAVAAGVDPAAVEESWLASLDAETRRALIGEAETFLRDTFLVRLADSDALAGATVDFESPEVTDLPPGCLLGRIEFSNPGASTPFSVGFSPSAQKRLLLSIARPAAFPEVRDLAPGESMDIALPPAPPRPPSPHPWRWPDRTGGVGFLAPEKSAFRSCQIDGHRLKWRDDVSSRVSATDQRLGIPLEWW